MLSKFYNWVEEVNGREDLTREQKARLAKADEILAEFFKYLVDGDEVEISDKILDECENATNVEKAVEKAIQPYLRTEVDWWDNVDYNNELLHRESLMNQFV